MFRLDDKKFTATKPPIPLASVVGFGMSTGVDQALVIKLQTKDDLVITLRGEACAPELVAVIIGLMDASDIPVEIDSKVHMTRKAATQSLTFAAAEKDEETTKFVKRRASGFALMTRKASMIQRLPPNAAEKASPRRQSKPVVSAMPAITE